MKRKTSVTLAEETVAAIDEMATAVRCARDLSLGARRFIIEG